jgi:hypothetical protein
MPASILRERIIVDQAPLESSLEGVDTNTLVVEATASAGHARFVRRSRGYLLYFPMPVLYSSYRPAARAAAERGGKQDGKRGAREEAGE